MCNMLIDSVSAFRWVEIGKHKHTHTDLQEIRPRTGAATLLLKYEWF